MPLVAGAQLRAARALLDLTKEELARLAGVNPTTLRKLERTEGPLSAHQGTLRTIEATLLERGVVLINGDTPGAYLRRSASA